MGQGLMNWEIGTNRDPNQGLYNANQIGSIYDTDIQGMLGDTKYTQWGAEQGLDFNAMTNDQIQSSFDMYRGSNNDTGTNWGINGVGGTAVGLGQLGVGIASYLDQKKTAEAQRGLMGQQYASNAYQMQKQKQNDAAVMAAFA